MAMMGMPLAAIPAPGVTGGRPRKEAVYDEEVYPNNAALRTTLECFANFTTYNTAPVGVALTKQRGRSTNLSGAGGQGLPSNHLLFWYEWRMKLIPRGANLTTAANAVVSEEIYRILGLSSVKFTFSQTTLIEAQADELPSGVGPQFAHSTHSNAFTVSLPNGIPDRSGKVVTVTGKPVQINPQQEFRCQNTVAQNLAFTPTVDIFVTHLLEGLLIRAVTG